jgi:cytochrome c biogenesis protein CcdA/thiol-disulfide isomerase/thioredoxin
MVSDLTQLKYWLWMASLILVLALAWGGGRVQAQNVSVVRVVYFYAGDCEHCIAVNNEVLTPLQDEYGDRLQIKMIETNSDPANYEMLIRAEEMFAVPPEKRGFPTLIVADQVLVGEDEIREQLACLLDTCLGEGGTLWPDIPGLERIFVEGQGGPSFGFEVGLIGEQPCSSEETETCAQETIFAAYFYQVGCQDCSRAEADIRYVRNRHTQLVPEEFNIYESMDLAQCLAERVGREEDLHTPVLFIGHDALVGQEEITPQNLEALIAKYESTGAERIWEECNSPAVKLPEMMTVVAAGLVDGLNPCAFATLVFFVSYLSLSGREGREVLIVGVAFTMGVFLAYLVVGLGFYKVLDLLGDVLTTLGRWVYGLTALLCAGLAVFSFLDFLKARRGDIGDMALNLPHGLRMRINAVIRKGRKSRSFIVGAFVTGVVVSFLELACTGQVYLPTIIFVISQPEMRVRALAFLLLYNLLFILPLVVVFVLAYYGTGSKQLTRFLQRQAAAVKLGMTLLFAALGAWLVISVLTT